MDHRNRVSRRDFLKSAVAWAAGPYVITSLGRSLARGAPPPSGRITVGVIGCGGRGRSLLTSFLDQKDVQPVALCDVDQGQLASARQIVHEKRGEQTTCFETGDFRAVLERDDVDAVIIATPDHWHAIPVIAAARAGKDIYGEKPLSLTLAEGRAMVDEVTRAGCVFQTGSQQRSDGRFRLAAELVRNGRLGRLRRITCGLPTGHTHPNITPQPVPEGLDYDMWLGPAPREPYHPKRCHWNYRWILDYSGGQVTDWGGHHPDIAQWAMNTCESGPVRVEGTGEFPATGLFDAAVRFRFVCTYASGVEMVVTDRARRGVKFEGDDGWVFVSRGRLEAGPEALLRDKIGSSEIHLPISRNHVRDFLDCVRSRRRPIAPIEHGHRSISIAHMGNIAMQLGRPLRWDPRTETFDDETANRLRSRAYRQPWQL
jgi:predicted dehydrogenase